MISYTARAAKALGFLKKHYNDIEIFVEDTANPAMWLRLLEKVLPKYVNVHSVNLMGGKENVVQACKLDQADDGRKKLYIIDADFDYLTNKKKPRLKHLYRINSYCIENVILHPHCVTELCLDCAPKMGRQNAYSTINFANMIGIHEPLLRTLFLVYAASQELHTGVQTVKHSVYRLMSKLNGIWQFDPGKIKLRIKQVVRDSVRAAGLKPFIKKRKELDLRAKTLPFNRVVSGKDCILPVFFEQLSKRFNYRGNLEQFKVQLAKEFKPRFEPSLSRRILSIAV